VGIRERLLSFVVARRVGPLVSTAILGVRRNAATAEERGRARIPTWDAGS